MIRLLRWLASLAVLLLLLAVGAYDLREQLEAPLQLAAPLDFELASGSRLDGNLAKLAQQGAFATPRQRWYLLAWARTAGRDHHIRAGEYLIEPGITPLGLLALWQSGKTVQHELRFIEGWRFEQALAAVRANPELAHTLNEADDAKLMQALGLNAAHPEGRFFPDTYRFSRGTPDTVVLKNAYAELDKVLQAEWAQRAQNLPVATADEALVLASIVEKETGNAAERAQIAGVFSRRLRLGMKLQTDPTVIYGLGHAFDGDLRSADLVRDTPYNTYTRSGLPPTPICLPGRESIHAALHPDDGDALYFVAKGDGTHQFSATLEQHNEAVRRYQLHGGSR
jgi:UPF0755 protein